MTDLIQTMPNQKGQENEIQGAHHRSLLFITLLPFSGVDRVKSKDPKPFKLQKEMLVVPTGFEPVFVP